MVFDKIRSTLNLQINTNIKPPFQMSIPWITFVNSDKSRGNVFGSSTKVTDSLVFETVYESSLEYGKNQKGLTSSLR